MKTLAIRSDFDLKLSGLRCLFWTVEHLNPSKGFEHVKGYAGFAAVNLGFAANM